MGAVGIDTGATTTRVWRGTGPVRRVGTPTAYRDYLRLLERELADPPTSLTIAVPATVYDGRLVAAGNLDPSWFGPNLADDMAALLGPETPVEIVQDTAAAGYAVRAHEYGDARSALVVTLSTGVGAAWVDPEFVRGLEVGHMPLDLSGRGVACACGQRGCVEADLSGTAVRRHTGQPAERLEDVEFWREYGTWLGRLVTVLTPAYLVDRVVLMGGVSARGESYLDTARHVVSRELRYLPAPVLTVSAMAADIGVIGAYERARDLGRRVEHGGR